MVMINVGSVTRAARARDLLFDRNIKSSVRRAAEDSEGCSHGVVVRQEDLSAAMSILADSNIKIRKTSEV